MHRRQDASRYSLECRCVKCTGSGHQRTRQGNALPCSGRRDEDLRMCVGIEATPVQGTGMKDQWGSSKNFKTLDLAENYEMVAGL